MFIVLGNNDRRMVRERQEGVRDGEHDMQKVKRKKDGSRKPGSETALRTSLTHGKKRW